MGGGNEVEELVIGRSPSRTSLAGARAAALFGKDLSTGKHVYFDFARPHVCLVTGKRGSGKSYTQSNLIEGIATLDEHTRNGVAAIVLDTMGIFWSVRYPNTNPQEIDWLEEYGLSPSRVEADVYVPQTLRERYRIKDKVFSLAPSDITPENWCLTFGLDQNSPLGIVMTRSVAILRKTGLAFDIDDIIEEIRKDKRATSQTQEALENRLEAAKSWGVFSSQGLSIDEFLKGGKISIIDLSQLYYSAETWSIRSLVVALICERVLTSLMERRRASQVKAVEQGDVDSLKDCPQVWMFVDEAHQFLPSSGVTAASWPLKRMIREGRQPGVSLVLATQQPGKLDSDVITQCDIAISHHITSKPDIDGLNTIMHTYQKQSIQHSLSQLPKHPGAALVIDDTRETLQSIQVRPKMTLHAGDSPDLLASLLEIL